MKPDLAIDAGAPVELPPAAGPWRVEGSPVEVYFAGPASRRLIGIVEPGEHVFGLPRNGGASLVLVSERPATLLDASHDDAAASSAKWIAACCAAAGVTPPDAASTDVGAFNAGLEQWFEEADRERDARVAQRLSEHRPKAASVDDGIVPAVAAAGAHLGLEVDQRRLPQAAADATAVPTIARLAGLRASAMVLPPRWWRDDMGPLLLREREGGRATAAVWSRGAYRDPGGEPFDGPRGAGHDGLAYRFFAPLGDDVSRFTGMARQVLRSLGRQELLFIAGAGLGAALVGMLVPMASAWIFDDIVPAGEGGLLVAVGLALLAASLVNGLFGVVRALAVARASGRGSIALAAALNDRVLRLPARFFKSMSAGDFNQRLDSLEAVRGLVLSTLLGAGLTLVFSVAYLALLFTYDARMALVGLALTLVYVGAVVLSRALQSAPLREAAERDGKLAGLSFEILDAVPKLRSAAAEPRMLRRWADAYAAERLATARGERIGIHFQSFADSWYIVTLVGLFAVAALLSQGALSPGRFIGFLAAFAVFQSNFAAFSESLMAIYTAKPLADRARPILTEPVETGIGRADPGRLAGRIQASGLSFAYAEGRPLIDGLSFEVEPGEHLAIVGGSGSGKSTVLRLLLGFERPTTGSILYDGQELSSLDPARVRGQIGVVLQSSQLFAGSIQENIRGASDAGLAECMLASERAGLAEDLKGMAMGLHTPITEGAGTLSGGQRQRILIARALVAEPRILLFDEATSALDNATQAIVARTLDSLSATRITIAHRLSTVRNADRIAVLERGRFVEIGDFKTLMAKDGAFAALARRQLMED